MAVSEAAFEAGSAASGRPQRLFLLGHPVGHSKSAAMYNAVYGALGLPWRYDLLDCPTEDEARAVLEARAFLSVNITTPYKPLAFASADARDASAVLANGANVLVNSGGRLVAHNTDGAGCASFLARQGCALSGARAAVCGTGPTALAIMAALAQAGASEVLLMGRDAARARAVLDAWCERARPLGLGGAALRAASYDEAAADLQRADLVVNATPLGMRPGDPAPFDVSLLRAGQWAFDCVYGHGTTAFVAAARAAGCRAYDGAGMLVMQAVETVRIVARAAGVSVQADDDRLFCLMADAAGFAL